MTSLWSTNIFGPTAQPCNARAPSIMAVAVLPGMPRTNMVARAPPSEALLALSGPTMPSGTPVPNLSPFLHRFLLQLYPRTPAMALPAAGMIPTTVPRMEQSRD